MKTYIYYILIFISIVSITSCEEIKPEPTGIEFITFEERSLDYLLDESSTFNTELKIYTASNVSSDLTLNLNVTTSLDASNYTLPATVIIPANSNEGNIDLTIVENNLDKINGETMTIDFESPDGYFKGSTEINIKINVFCPSSIAGSYKYSDGANKDITISNGTGVNNFIVNGDNYFGTNYPFYINDQCGAITVTGGFLSDNFGIPVSGSGNVQDNGDIVISYTVDGYFDNRTMTLVKQ